MADSILAYDFDLPLSRASAEGDEEHLVVSLRAGSEAAYETLLARYQGPVYNLVARLVSDPGDAADIVQEVFLKVFRNLPAFRGGSSLKTWIYRIAVNEAHNHRRWFSRHRKQQVGLEREDEGLGLGDSLADAGPSPFDLVLDQETRALIEAALLEMSPVFRTAVVLRDIEELTYEEIAEVLQVSMGTVKSRILRGRESLRKLLADRLQGEPAFTGRPQSAVK